MNMAEHLPLGLLNLGLLSLKSDNIFKRKIKILRKTKASTFYSISQFVMRVLC